MMVHGPYVTKPVTVPEHTEEVLDTSAYWNLDFDGSELAGGEPMTLLYAKVAWPTLAAAKHQFQLERDALAARNAPKTRRRSRYG
jgi:hypothetical protein